MRVVAEHDVQRSVRVRGEAAGPHRTGREVGGTRDRLQRRGVDALDPRDDLRAERMTEQEDLTGLAQHDHRRRDRFP